jgi:predicted metal-dependent RNase
VYSRLQRQRSPPARSVVDHGDAQTACGFAATIADRLRWTVQAPATGTRAEL